MNTMNTDFLQKIEQLPDVDALRIELQSFLDYLTFKYTRLTEQKNENSIGNKLKIRGIAKGKIKMSADFDAPLEDFEDYMPESL